MLWCLVSPPGQRRGGRGGGEGVLRSRPPRCALLQHAARSTQHAARSTQHAARSTQHAARSTQHAQLQCPQGPAPHLCSGLAAVAPWLGARWMCVVGESRLLQLWRTTGRAWPLQLLPPARRRCTSVHCGGMNETGLGRVHRRTLWGHVHNAGVSKVVGAHLEVKDCCWAEARPGCRSPGGRAGRWTAPRRRPRPLRWALTWRATARWPPGWMSKGRVMLSRPCSR
jgi:hypothetical protein